MAPLCYVLMSQETGATAPGVAIDFGVVYRDLVEPAIRRAGMEPFRVREDPSRGTPDPLAFEHFLLCDFALVDLTVERPGADYASGVRDGVRPGTTLYIAAAGDEHGGDRARAASVRYATDAGGTPVDPPAAQDRLHRALVELQEARAHGAIDAAVHRLIETRRQLDVARLKTDVFRERTRYDEDVREKLRQARDAGPAQLTALGVTLGDPAELEAGVAIDLLLSYRAVGDVQAMVDLYERMAAPLQRVVMVREQVAFALNRLKQSDRAEQVLTALIAEHGASSETNGLLGRLYKDRWDAARQAGDAGAAAEWLVRAIDAYLQGFEADWRDAYPGVNAVTLMELRTPPDPRRLELLPVVTYSVRQRIANGCPDYWDHATLVELAILGCDEAAARRSLNDALQAVRERWEPETTARNLRLIREARAARGEQNAWAADVERALHDRSQP